MEHQSAKTPKVPIMAATFDGISQKLDFTIEEDGSSSSDNSLDDYTFRIRSPRVASPRFLDPESACRTPRVQRHRTGSSTVSSPLQCTSPIPYASWRKLRLCDSPSTPKVGRALLQMRQTCSFTSDGQPASPISLSSQSLLSKSSQPCSSTKTCRTQRTLRFASSAASFIQVPPSVNVNPFTPETVRRSCSSTELRWRSSFRAVADDDDEDYGRRYLLLRGQSFFIA